MPSDATRRLVRYSGHVQGVGFRMTAIAAARGLSVHGYVQNQPDGSVLMDVEGSPRDIKDLMARIASSMSGHIDATTVDTRPPRGLKDGLEIRH